MYYTILYYTILYCTVLYCTVLYYTILYCTVLYCTILYYTVLYCTVLYCTVLYYTILYYTILYYTILYYTILYYTILYYTILYYTNTILYLNVLSVANRISSCSLWLPKYLLLLLFIFTSLILTNIRGDLYQWIQILLVNSKLAQILPRLIMFLKTSPQTHIMSSIFFPFSILIYYLFTRNFNIISPSELGIHIRSPYILSRWNWISIFHFPADH
jgi:hypothetical protein